MMKKGLGTTLVGTTAALFVLATSVSADHIQRRRAQFKNFDSSETATATGAAAGGAGGTVVYSTTVTPPSSGFWYVSMFAFGDMHDGARIFLNCTRSGAPCNPGTGGAGFAPTGWVNAMNQFAYTSTYTLPGGSPISGGDGSGGNGDQHDNPLVATWCVRAISGTPNLIQIKMATSHPGSTVFFEAAHFYTDFSTRGCGPFLGP